MTNESKCYLAHKCKRAGEESQCNNLCYPFIRLHGENGEGGVIKVAGVPKKYRSNRSDQLPFEEANPKAFKVITVYCKDVINQVKRGTGLYLHGIPNEQNPKGCGNGKTTAAVAILNEYLIARVIQDVTKEQRIDNVPALFMNVSKFQNTFNSMFRGTKERQEQAAEGYYTLKARMKKVPLLVMDDIGIRDSTESFKSEFYEIIDDRANEGLATIYTSNVPIKALEKILDERIASRIEGATAIIPFSGKDNRKRGF